MYYWKSEISFRFALLEIHRISTIFTIHWFSNVIYNTANEDIYNHFAKLSCAVRMLSCLQTYLEKVTTAELLLRNFVENFGDLYGTEKISYNVHNLLHISDLKYKYNINYIKCR